MLPSDGLEALFESSTLLVVILFCYNVFLAETAVAAVVVVAVPLNAVGVLFFVLLLVEGTVEVVSRGLSPVF